MVKRNSQELSVLDCDFVFCHQTQMTDEQIILALGDSAALAERIGNNLTSRAVCHWKSRGIPWKWRHEVRKVAIKAKIKLPENFLYEKALS